MASNINSIYWSWRPITNKQCTKINLKGYSYKIMNTVQIVAYANIAYKTVSIKSNKIHCRAHNTISNATWYPQRTAY